MVKKKMLTKDQEFDIFKLVLDKFLLLGVVIIAYGFYQMVNYTSSVWYGLGILVSGACLILIFMAMLVKEFEYSK